MANTINRFQNAVVFRSIALFAVLYQLRLVAGDLADTVIFSGALFAAFATAVFLALVNPVPGKITAGTKMRPLAALAAIGLIPWAVRAFIALPGMVVSAVSLDALLLNFDRNNVAALLPFYWTAATTWFAIRSRTFLRGAVIADALILAAVFGFTRVSDVAMYRWPIVMIVLMACIVFAQAQALLFSLPPEVMLKKSEKIAGIAALAVLIFAGGLFFLKPSQEQAAQKGGGLLEPKLFSFDFSQFLRLDSEISMNDDLVLIVKKDSDDDHVLLRRSVMSGYGKKQGFYRVEAIDEKNHPQRLPSGPVELPPPEIESARMVRQEYFLVNFDAAAFIGMNEPVEIIPYESWDSSSFKSAYAVESLASNAIFNLRATVAPGPEDLGLSEREFALYTGYGDDERIRSLAEEVTRGIANYSDKVEMIHDWLKYGEYRYSLKPGIAPDGDQLAWFLFESKKGYCSYYAFAMALMLRSLGIPARVAAGFFIDPESSVFDYYAIRSDMAHAWVEVPFPGYGWLEFDPTSRDLAEGEEFRFSPGVDPGLFERLMKEILENRSRLRVKTGQDAADTVTGTGAFIRLTAAFLKKLALPLLILSLLMVFVLIRCGCFLLSFIHRDARKKALDLWKHTRRRLRLAGIIRPLSLSEAEWAMRCDSLVKGTYAMYLGGAAARFAPEYHHKDFAALRGTYRLFSESYRKAVAPLRRFIAWFFPPAALARRNAGLLLLLLMAVFAGSGTRAQDAETGFASADELYRGALEAEYSEYWERAIDLFRQGGAAYPDDIRFPRALGHLYYSRSLYSLAWDEYRKAELLDPFDTAILLRLANTAGHLNRDTTAVAYLEQLLAIDPEYKEAIGNLGWMYYKVHRLEDGEQLLVSALERFGDDADLTMTLATVYSGMYRYEEGKYWYQKAMSLAEPLRSFTSVAHYNLSILESRFQHYDLAMNEANASLDVQNRASGLLARGELYMRQMDLLQARTDFQSAHETDSSPLSKINLAQLYQVSGRLEEARLYALECLRTGDHSWMMYYGIDPVRYKRDIHEILYKTYSGLARAERFVPCGTLGAAIRSWLNALSFRFYGEVHRKLYQKYSLAAGDAYGLNSAAVSLPVEQLVQYYNAFETYPRRALVYLNKARDFETALIPEAEASYNLEAGTLMRDTSLVARALNELDPVWEQDLIFHCYLEFARQGLPGKTRRQSRQTAAEELFTLNRGALLQAGIRLPVEIHPRYAALPLREKTLLHALASAGFAPGGPGDGSRRFRLDVTISELPAGGYTVSCELTDTENGEQLLRRNIPLRSLSKADIYNFAGTLSKAVFTVSFSS